MRELGTFILEERTSKWILTAAFKYLRSAVEDRAEILDAVSNALDSKVDFGLFCNYINRKGGTLSPAEGFLPSAAHHDLPSLEQDLNVGASLIEHCSSLFWLTKNINIPGLVPNLER